MEQLSPPFESLPNAKLLSILFATGVPVVGLLSFDTSARALLVFYWLELGVVMLWAIIRAVFAGKRPHRENKLEDLAGTPGAILRVISSSRFFASETEDSTSTIEKWLSTRILIPRTDVGIYLGTIPALVFIIPMLTVVWIGFGGVVAGPVVAATNTTDTPTWILTGAGIIFLSEGGQTVVEYFYRGHHRETTVGMAVKGIFWQGFAMVGAGLVVLLIAFGFAEGRSVSVESAASGPLIFVAISCKFLIDLAMYYLDKLDQPLQEYI